LVPGLGDAGLVSLLDRRSGTDDKVVVQRLDGSGRIGDPTPLLTQVTDVPNDDGGQVRIKWNASYLDTVPTLEIGTYGIWREVTADAARRAARAGARMLGQDDAVEEVRPGLYREDASATGTTYWEGVGSIPARGQPIYSYAAPTLADSSDLGTFASNYMVDAHAAFFPYFWSANPLSGYSVDNLRPAMPAGFAAQAMAGGVTLRWQPNGELDLRGYRIHRGSGDFPIGPANLIASLSDTAYFDPGGNVAETYKLIAVDIHGNASNAAVGQPQGAVGVGDVPIPTVLSLATAGPNPIRESCTFRLGIPASMSVRLAVYDPNGRSVRVLLDQIMPPGMHDVRWDGRDASGHAVASGVYLTRLDSGDRRITKRVVRVQ
jgi:hypothetical protein